MEFFESELDVNNIMSGDDVDSLHLFDDEETQETLPEEKEDKKDKTDTTENEVNPEELFDSESVGSEKEDKDKEEKETSESAKDGLSPKPNFYNSIANALVDDGVLNLEKEYVDKIKTPEDLAEAIDKQVNLRLDEKQRRISEALEANVSPDEIKQYETVLGNLDKITEDSIKDESSKGENLRKQLIYQDLLNKGFSKERATREIKKSFDSGSDIEDALEALENNKAYFKNLYEELIQEGQEKVKNDNKRLKEEAAALRKQMLEDKEVFEGIVLDKNTRQKAYDSITKPVYKTEEGEYLTAVQKYQNDNPVEFRKKLGVLFTLTNGFKNIDNLVKDKVRKEVKSSMRELEHTLKNTSRATGNPRFVGSDIDDSESSKGWTIDA